MVKLLTSSIPDVTRNSKFLIRQLLFMLFGLVDPRGMPGKSFSPVQFLSLSWQFLENLAR